MYQTTPTEMFRERQLALLREVEERRLARRRRRASASKQDPRRVGWMAGFRRTIALWGRTSAPFFRA